MNQQRRPARRQPRRKTVKYTECANAKFDEQWGEYKCITRCIRISNPTLCTGCKTFKKKPEKK